MIYHPKLDSYLESHTTGLPDVFSELSDETMKAFPKAHHMQVGVVEGRFLQMMTKLHGARSILEVGTFTGFSSLCFGLAAGPDGKVVCLDVDPHATKIAQKYWEKTGISSRMELRIGAALESLKILGQEIRSGQRPRFDLVFVDADKRNYGAYVDLALEMLSDQGSILVDNTLWSGGVLEPEEESDYRMIEFNQKIRNDVRLESMILPIRDGITWIRKRQDLNIKQ